MRIIYHERHRLAPEIEGNTRCFGDLLAMLPHCQVLSLHTPATPQTQRDHERAGVRALAKGGSVRQRRAWKSRRRRRADHCADVGHLFAAGLDVFQHEPAFDRRFAALPNLFLTPHVGSGTLETREAMGFLALDDAAAVCDGRPPHNGSRFRRRNASSSAVSDAFSMRGCLPRPEPPGLAQTASGSSLRLIDDDGRYCRFRLRRFIAKLESVYASRADSNSAESTSRTANHASHASC